MKTNAYGMLPFVCKGEKIVTDKYDRLYMYRLFVEGYVTFGSLTEGEVGSYSIGTGTLYTV